MEAIANAGILLSLVIESSYYHKEDNGVEMHDLDLTDIKVMNSPYFICNPMIMLSH
jgi:polysaccharide export outer membrane protein